MYPPACNRPAEPYGGVKHRVQNVTANRSFDPIIPFNYICKLDSP